MKIAVLAVQGDFAEHEAMLRRLGTEYVELRSKKDLGEGYDALILPGGESTVQGKLLRELDMFGKLKEQIDDGLPVLATCAGLILLAGEIEGTKERHLATLPATVRRNAYGRQLESFHTYDAVEGIGIVPMTFIRAPFITRVRGSARIIAYAGGHAAGVQYKNQIALSFHPELDKDTGIFESFLHMVKKEPFKAVRDNST